MKTSMVSADHIQQSSQYMDKGSIWIIVHEPLNL